MADQNAIETFKSVTGADDNTANFYLSAANNNLAGAVQAYFDAKQSAPTQAAPQQAQAQPQAQPQPQQPTGRRLGSGSASEPVAYTPAPAPAQAAPAKKSAPAKQPQKFKSLLDMQNDDDDSDDEHNRYFAGGSKGSGELIIGGNKKSDDDDLTSKIFKKAVEQGAAPPQPRQQDPNNFVGKGNRLGSGDVQPQQPQQQPPSTGQQQPQGDDDEEKPRNITLTFYLDGFTVDDGELKRFDDPANKHILEAITQGYVPAELAGGAKAVDVALVKKNEKYSPPPKVFKAFGGSGKALGANATPSTPVQPTTTTTVASSYSCDLNKPHTSLQLRLHDGTKLVAKFNLTDTVQTICNFVAASCPGLSRPFVLATTFPKKELVDMAQTIEQAKLQNAALVQTLK